MAKGIYEVDVIINDESVQAAIKRAKALTTGTAKLGGPPAASQQLLAAEAGRIDVLKEQARAAGRPKASIDRLTAAGDALRAAYVALAGDVKAERYVHRDFSAAKREAAQAYRVEAARARNNAGRDFDPESLRSKVLEREQLREEVSALRAVDPEIGDAVAGRAVYDQRTRANTTERLAKDDAALADAHRQQANSATKRLALLNRTLRGDNELLAVQAQTLVAAKQVQAAERQLAAATLKAAVQSGELGRGSLIQRLQANVSNRQGGPLRAPTEFASGRQLAAGSLLTTGRFALSGGLLYGGIQGISTAIKEAQELEKVFNQIRRQFESLGKTGEFEGFANNILRIARETGAAGAEVAFVGFQLQGAFGGDTARAVRETEAAFQAVKVTGLSINEVIDAFTALTQNFDAAGVSIADVSDTALGLQERFGVLAKETISFAADLAPVAAQAGFTVQQLEALGAVGQKYSGRSGTSLAEAFGRILPAIQGNAVEFLQLFEQVGNSNVADQVAEAFRSGNIAEFFEILLRQYSDLSGAQKNYVIELLGGRREAQALIPILENSGELLDEFANAQTDAGKTAEYFSDLQQTLGQQLAEFGEELSQLAIKLLNSGITDFFEDIIRLGAGAIDILTTLLGVLDAVGGALGAIPGLGGGLGSVIEGVLLYKGLGLAAGGVRSLLGRGAAAAGAGAAARPLLNASAGATGGLAAIGPQVAGATLAQRIAGGAAGKTGAAAFAGGLKGAVAGFNWVGVGLTVGTLVASQISDGVRKRAGETINAIAGTTPGGDDARFDDAELGLLGKEFGGNTTSDLSGLAETYRGAKSAIDGAPNLSADIKTIGELRSAMVASAKEDASKWQQVLSAGGFSQDTQENTDAANAAVDEHKARYTEFFSGIAEDEELLNELARQRLQGTPKEGNKVEIGKLVERYRDDLNGLVAEIIDESADPDSVQAVAEKFVTLQGQVRQAIANRLREEQQELAQQSLNILTADEAIQGFEQGEVGLAQTRQALRSAVAGRQSLGHATGTGEEQKELADLIRREREFQSEILLREAEAITEGVEGFNTTTPAQRVSSIVQLLRSGRLTPKDQAKATDLALGALKDVHQARLDAADTAAEEARILAEGTPVPEELQTELVYQYLANASVAFQDFVSVAANGVMEVASEITRTAARIYAAGGVTFNQAVRQAIIQQITVLSALRAKMVEGLATAAAVAGVGGFDSISDTAKFYDDQVASLYNSLGTIPDVDVPDFGNFGVDAAGAAAKLKQAEEEAKREREEAARKAHDIRLAELDVYKAYIEGDPIAEADLDARIAQENAAFARSQGDRAGELNAQAALIRAQRARQEAELQIQQASYDFGLARSGDAPIAVAYTDLVIANEAVRVARGAAAKLRAQAEQQRAARTLQEAIQDVGLAQLELAQAIADAAGDSVGAARKALEIAQQQLANIRANSPHDQAAILRAQADVVGAEASLRDADLAERQRAIDVALQLEQITVGQAIAQLQALLQIPKLTKEQTDAILLKIKSLKDELEGDFRFNLPTTIALPTAYEVARLSQTPQGSGYNDNRVQTVTVNVDTNASPEQIAAAVVDAVGQPNRQGTVPKRY